MPTWRDDKLLELASQLTYSPADKRREQLTASLDLAHAIDPAKTYPWDFIHFRITGFPPLAHSDHTLPGKTLRADLSTLIEFLSDTLAIPIDEAPAQGPQGDGGILALEEVSARFSVSAKTIQRWRKQGLIAMRYVYPDGRRRLGFHEAAVARFAAENRERVARSASFKQLSDDEKSKIIAMARRFAGRCRCSIKDVSRRIARRLNRSPETIRYTLRNYDREHPEAAIFPEGSEFSRSDDTLRPTDHSAILASFDSGTPLDSIAERFSRTKAAIFRVITRERAARLKSAPIDFVPNPLFEHPEADNIILTVLPTEAFAKAQATVAAGTNASASDVYMARMPRDLPPFLQDIFRQPVMPQELETDTFRRMNYLKWKAATLQARLETESATPAALAEIEALMTQATDLKNQLVQANLRVAVHVARKHQRSGKPLLELVSDAAVWLMRAAEKFDFARGGAGAAHARFSTYASYAIMKNFARDRSDGLARRDAALVTGQEELLNNLNTPDAAHPADHLDAAALHSDLRSLVEELPTRERELLTHHYGLNDQSPPLSLSEISSKMGITKARVQQLETRALRKLRHLLESRRRTLAPHP
ncbi:MAG TPA: sigma-70 family RNA polymerase sigma factor [Phycisphaerae bacterium]|nr:sigma-70 family RNA polymerase sigma factor [Phycisphaerae bacterium]